MLGVIGAMSEEVQLMLSEMRDIQQTVHADITVTQGNYKGTDIALAQSGIGKVNATICTQMLIDIYKPKKLVFSGVAGGLLPNMRAGDIIIASHVVQYDMDLTAFGRRHGETPGRERLIECDPDLVGKATAAFDAAFDGVDGGPNLMLGTIASGDRFIQDTGTQRWLQREFAALAAEMEGAAVGYTCYLNGLPFAVIRALSDASSESASDDFEQNLHNACQNTYHLMDRMIQTAMVEPEQRDRRKSDRTDSAQGNPQDRFQVVNGLAGG
ncbi:MAG: 5'-methylthioadenosine/adenosylhomocysteine nucleosidase [Alphaproteobacteria bacterium]|nr:5'-methylthioadenosine/adenosylhomocysteine nucleosidase [Alphaproteobacteria bacterium]